MYKNKKTRPAARTVGCLFALGALGLGERGARRRGVLPNSKWMLGDWGGKRTELLEKGYDFKLEYVGEAAANLDGGYDDDKTGRYTDQFALGVHMDLEKILGWKATSSSSPSPSATARTFPTTASATRVPGASARCRRSWGRGRPAADPAVAQAAVLRTARWT
ncbi:hypothetical protein P4200_33530 [Pseudomonas aeruginosa]|nr:hypothetical protein [Pseudomonas aeruginosa]